MVRAPLYHGADLNARRRIPQARSGALWLRETVASRLGTTGGASHMAASGRMVCGARGQPGGKRPRSPSGDFIVLKTFKEASALIIPIHVIHSGGSLIGAHTREPRLC